MATLPEVARYFLALSLEETTRLASDSYPNDASAKPVIESLNQTVERAVWTAAKLD